MRHIIYLLSLMLALASIGCGGGSGGIGSPSGYTGNPGVPPVVDPGTTPGTVLTGTQVALTLNKEMLDEYVGWTTNAPTEGILVVNLSKIATFAKAGGGYDYSFGGSVSVKFKDNGVSFVDTFSSKIVTTPCYYTYGTNCNTVSSNTQNNAYNLLSSDYPGQSGTMAYHGFFEDTRTVRDRPPMYGAPNFGGAIVLVIDHTNDSGDGQGPTLANGSIWFKNIVAQYPMGPQPNTSCWFISAGPYDCRAWKSSQAVNTKGSMYPDYGYQKLGTFNGLEIKSAFNNEI